MPKKIVVIVKKNSPMWEALQELAKSDPDLKVVSDESPSSPLSSRVVAPQTLDIPGFSLNDD